MIEIKAPTLPLGNLDEFFPRPEYQPGKPIDFIHVRKCAGTTVRLTIENLFHGSRVFPVAPEVTHGYMAYEGILEHKIDLKQYDLISGHLGSMVMPMLQPETNYFTWLRSPRERALSHFLFFVVQRVSKRPHRKKYHDMITAGERLESVFMKWLRDCPRDPSIYEMQIIGMNFDDHSDTWRSIYPGHSAMDVVRKVLRPCFFIGLQEDYDRSLDAFCALTGTLPPRQSIRRNAGTYRKTKLELTEAENAEFEETIKSDMELFDQIRELYDRQFAEFANMQDRFPDLRYIGDREGLRASILAKAASAGRMDLSQWHCWDHIYGENLDGREFLKEVEGDVPSGETLFRWRWTCPKPDTYLYFRISQGVSQVLTLRLHAATPKANVLALRLKVGGKAVPLLLTIEESGAYTVEGILGRAFLAGLPETEYTEFHLHTPVMLDEKTEDVFAGTRMLGVALVTISLSPVTEMAAS